MNAYLTFIRQIDKKFHFIAIDNPINLDDCKDLDLISGQPIICIIDNNHLKSLYVIQANGMMNQIFGNNDDLFLMKELQDRSLVNLKKYNIIKYFIIKLLEKLSFKELNNYYNDLKNFENNIFYSLLHCEINIQNIKNYMIKEIKKINFSHSIKINFLKWINQIRMPSKKILNKKIDVNLSGYGIYINTRIQ